MAISETKLIPPNVRGGRSAGRGGATAEEMRDYEESKRNAVLKRLPLISPVNPVGVRGGRSAGRGGATAEELRDYEEEGITTERKIKRGDYGGPGKAPMDLMPPVKKAMGGMTKKYANGGSVRGAGVAQRGVKQCKMV
jgi:hypothetical protein